MSEFSATPEDRVTPVASPASPRAAAPGVWKRKVVAGLSWPELIGVVLILGLAGWYLFGPERAPSIKQLAFREDFDEQPIAAAGPGTIPLSSTASASGLSQFQNEVAAMMGGIRTYAEVNRTAISTLSATVKSQGAVLATVQQQLVESQAQNSVLSARLSFLEGRPSAQAASQQPPKTQQAAKHVAPVRSPLNGMRLESIQNGMAWVYWQDRTWAVKSGDQLGQVTVTGIDAQTREVRTSAGTLK